MHVHCIFTHSWKYLIVNLSLHNKKVTRIERECRSCYKRQIKVDQFSPRVIKQIQQRFGEVEWAPYEKNNWLDVYTRAILTGKLDD